MSPKTLKLILLSLAVSGIMFNNLNSPALACEEDDETENVNTTPTACVLSEEERDALPTDVRKYVELSNTCRHWGDDSSKDSVGAVGEHANFSTTKCYTLQIRYNRLKNKYKEKPELLDLVDSCYVSF